MAQVPELGTDCDIGNDLEGERGRHVITVGPMGLWLSP
jgi:hypothetical protein